MNATNAAREIKVKLKQVILAQMEGEIDVLYFILDAPSPAPTEPDAIPVMIMGAAEGYGAQWLQDVYGIQPDEVIEG